MRRRYSAAFQPPCPVVPVVLRAPGDEASASLDGKIDTGSDLCAVPAHVIAELDLPPVRTVRASGFSGPAQQVIVYRVDLEIAGASLMRVEAVPTARSYVLVGRNALQVFVLRLDGPRSILGMKPPRSKPARKA